MHPHFSLKIYPTMLMTSTRVPSFYDDVVKGMVVWELGILVFVIFFQVDQRVISWASHLNSQGWFLHLQNKGVGLIDFQGAVYLQILFFLL